jgi:hypothetical protein
VNPLLKVDVEVDATDTNTKAEGTRSVKRGETLKMIHGKQAGETRTADVHYLSIVLSTSHYHRTSLSGKAPEKLKNRMAN